jgi:hypothetical protein
MKERMTRRDSLKLGVSLVLSTLGTGLALGGLVSESNIKPYKLSTTSTSENEQEIVQNIEQKRLDGAYTLIWDKTIPIKGEDAFFLDTYYQRFAMYSIPSIVKISREKPREKPYSGILEVPYDLFENSPHQENIQGIELTRLLLRSSVDKVLMTAKNPNKMRSISEWIFFYSYQHSDGMEKADDIFNPYYQWRGYEEEFTKTKDLMLSHPLDYFSVTVSSIAYHPQMLFEWINSLATTKTLDRDIYYQPVEVEIDEPSKRFAKLVLKESFNLLSELIVPEGEQKGDGWKAHYVEQTLPGFAKLRFDLGADSVY